MTTSTLTLAEFLLARIAEDEERADENHGLYDCDYSLVVFFGPGECTCTVPSRIRAECTAKRQLIQDHPGMVVFGGHQSDWNGLRTLASVYADHPDYRDEWRL